MILIRHGQSHFNAAYNKTRIDPGIVDPGLTDEGRRQIEAAAEALSGHDIRRIVTSPYQRTLETTAILAEALSLPVSIDPLVRERSYFSCDIGTPRTQLVTRWPKLDFADLTEVWWTDPEESESELEVRCSSFKSAMSVLDDWRHVLVVSHYAFILGLTGQIVPNAAIVPYALEIPATD